MKKVAILIEHPDREFLIAESIATTLNSYSTPIKVDIISILFHFDKTIFTNYDLIIFPSSWPILNSIGPLKHNTLFASFNFEQMLSSFNEEAKRPKKGFITSKLHHFSWSDDYSSYLAASSIEPEKIHQIQKPIYQALEIMPEKHHLSIDNRLLKKISSYKKIVFIPLTCLQGFKSNERIRKEFGNGILLERAIIRRDFVKKSIHQIFKWIVQLATEESKTVFILRPHPSVAIATYKDLFQELGIKPPLNIIISDKGTAIEWVTKSDIILSNYSSLLLDGLEYNIPSFILQPYIFPEDISYPWFSKFIKVESYKGLSQSLQIANSKPQSKPVTNGIDSSAKIILNILEEHPIKHDNLDGLRLISLANTIIFMLKSMIRRFLFCFAPIFLREGLKRDYFRSNSKVKK